MYSMVNKAQVIPEMARYGIIRNKFDCLIHEMLLIKYVKPSLSTQSNYVKYCLPTIYIHFMILCHSVLDKDVRYIETSHRFNFCF